MNNKPLKRVVFTLNNYTDDEYSRIISLSDEYLYAIVAREVCPSTGTQHLQGFINFKKKRRFNNIKQFIGHRLHLEEAKGDDHDNFLYCSKGGDFVQFGELSKRGKRSDLAGLCADLRAGATEAEIVVKHTQQYIRYGRNIRMAVGVLGGVTQRSWRTSLVVHWGVSGSGKSQRAAYYGRKLCGGVYYKVAGKWWDGYCGQNVVIMDDFCSDMCSFTEMLRIADCYPHQVEVKGGFVNFIAKWIFVTLNQNLFQSWGNLTFEQRNALRRRIVQSWNFQHHLVHCEVLDGLD